MEVTHLSIIIATLACPKTIRRAIESCLKITRHNVEIIIIVDGIHNNISHLIDTIPKLPANFNLVIREIERAGAAGARNFGINIAKGDWVIFLDDDDELFSENIELVLDCDLEGIDLVRGEYSAISTLDNQTKDWNSEYRNSQDLVKLEFSNPVSFFHEKGFWRYLYSRQFLNKFKVEFFPERKILNLDYKHEDFFFLCHALASRPIALSCNLRFYNYYVRPSNIQINMAYLSHLSLDLRVCNLFISSTKKRTSILDKEFLSRTILDRIFFSANYLFKNNTKVPLRELIMATLQVVLLYPPILALACKRMLKQITRRVVFK
jgi:glycosyltransferase involved in cell wall biosynthesis